MKKVRTILVATTIATTMLIQLLGIAVSNCPDEFLQQIVGFNIEAFARGEGYNPGDKLKTVKCTCQNQKKGISLKCRQDGTLESCTPTQQGSNACYKTKISTNPLEILCEGSGISFE